MKQRAILYVSIPDFPVAAERKRRPDLIGKPVIVGRQKGSKIGVVISASVDARKSGVEEEMSVRQAQRTCPGAVVLMADQAHYEQVYEQLLDILVQYSPLLEPDLLGGAYLDVTASCTLFGEPELIAVQIAREVWERLRMVVSIGRASNKLVAKIASCLEHILKMSRYSAIENKGSSGWRMNGSGLSIDSLEIGKDRSGAICSSRGIPGSGGICSFSCYVAPGSEADFLAPLPVSELDVVSPNIRKRLAELGVVTIGQLAAVPERLLVRQFGPVGSVIRRYSIGIDSSAVVARYPLDVIVSEHVFCDAVEEPAQVEEQLSLMVVDLVLKLRTRSRLAGKMMLSLFEDCGATNSRLITFKKPTDSAYTISQSASKMLLSIVSYGMEVSKVKIVLSDLTPGRSSQLSLIGDGDQGRRMERAIELIRERFGDGAIVFASALIPQGSAKFLSRIAA